MLQISVAQVVIFEICYLLFENVSLLEVEAYAEAQGIASH